MINNHDNDNKKFALIFTIAALIIIIALMLFIGLNDYIYNHKK